MESERILAKNLTIKDIYACAHRYVYIFLSLITFCHSWKHTFIGWLVILPLCLSELAAGRYLASIYRSQVPRFVDKNTVVWVGLARHSQQTSGLDSPVGFSVNMFLPTIPLSHPMTAGNLSKGEFAKKGEWFCSDQPQICKLARIPTPNSEEVVSQWQELVPTELARLTQ